MTPSKIPDTSEESSDLLHINDIQLITGRGNSFIVWIPFTNLYLSFSPYAIQELLFLARKHHFVPSSKNETKEN